MQVVSSTLKAGTTLKLNQVSCGHISNNFNTCEETDSPASVCPFAVTTTTTMQIVLPIHPIELLGSERRTPFRGAVADLKLLEVRHVSKFQYQSEQIGSKKPHSRQILNFYI